MFKILLLFIIYPFNLYSSDFKVTKKDNAVYLHGKNCEDIKQQAKKFEEWTKNLNEPTVSSLDCKCIDNTCSVKINTILPDIVETTLFKKPNVSGPNCYNSSLVAAKIIPSLRYSTNTEVGFWLNSPLCKERPNSEEPMPGDIITIYHHNGSVSHSFNHISNELSFTKNGYTKNNPYTIMPPSEVFEKYEVPKECIRTNDISNCPNYAKYYSCMSLDNYLKNHNHNDPELIKTIKKLDEVDCQIGESIFQAHNQKILDFLIDQVEVLNDMVFEIYFDKKFNSEDEFLWQGLYYQVAAMQSQLNRDPDEEDDEGSNTN